MYRDSKSKHLIIMCLLLLFALPVNLLGNDSKSFQLDGLYQEKDCGIISLAVICKLKNAGVSIERLNQMIDIGDKGISAASLIEAARELGLNSTGVKCSAQALANKNIPAIIEIRKGHFAVFAGFNHDTQKLLIIDLPDEPYYLTVAELEEKWSGKAILFSTSNNELKKSRIGPKAVVTPEMVDLGTIWQGDIVDCKFEIHNTGDAELRIVKVEVSCGCTTTKLEKKILAPGQKTTLSVTYDSKGKYQDTLIINKGVKILTNAKPDSISHMKIKAMVKPRFIVQPQKIYLRATKYTNLRDLKQSVKIQFLDDPKTTVKKIETSNPWLAGETVLFSSAINEQNVSETIVMLSINTVPPEMGTNYEDLLIHTNNPKYPVITVPIQFHMEGDYMVVPDMIYLGVKKPYDTVNRTIEIRKLRTSEDFFIEKITCDLPYITISEISKTLKDKHSFDVEVSVPNAPGKIAESIVVELDNGQSARIPVSGFIRKSKNPTDTP